MNKSQKFNANHKKDFDTVQTNDNLTTTWMQ